MQIGIVLITHINIGVYKGKAVAMPQKNVSTLEIQAFREACVELEKMLVDLKSGVEELETLQIEELPVATHRNFVEGMRRVQSFTTAIRESLLEHRLSKHVRDSRGVDG